MPNLGRCCRCGCEKINFKVFDFSDGTLIWQKRLSSPALDVNGNVFDLSVESEFEGNQASASPPNSTTDITLTFPNRSVAPARTYYVRQCDKYAAADGTLSSTSPPIEISRFEIGRLSLTGGGIITGTDEIRGMKPSAWQVNGNGDKVIAIGSAPDFDGYVVEPNSTATSMTYYFTGVASSSANVIFTDSDANVATVALGDNAAAIKLEIETELSCTSATVTGTSFDKTLMKIVIDWNDNTKYLDTVKLDYAASNTKIGNMHLLNLVSGEIGTGGTTGGNSSSYFGAYAWQSNGSLFRKSANPFNATIRRMESWDVSTQPWSLTWWDEPFGSRTPLGPGFDSIGLREIEIAADGGIVAISHPFTTATVDPLVSRSSVISWNNDGTGQEEYNNGGANFTGWLPLGLCMEDGSDKLGCNFRIWRDSGADEVHTGITWDDDVGQIYLSSDGKDTIRWSSGSTYALLSTTCRGDFVQRQFAGFTSTAAAICDTWRFSGEDGEQLADAPFDRMGYFVVTEPSGMTNATTLLPMDRWQLRYEVHTIGNSLIDDSTEWRIVFDDGATTEETGWFAKSATLATVNAELFTLFGESRNGDDNCVALAQSDTTPSTPLYKRALAIECYGAKTSIDETDMETPAIFNLGNGSQNTARGNMPEMRIELQTYNPDVPGTIGARNWSTGAVIWDRNFNTGSVPTLIDNGVLNNGQLYVLSTLQCSETIPDPGGGGPGEEEAP